MIGMLITMTMKRMWMMMKIMMRRMGMNKVIQWGSRLERIEDSLSKQWRWVC